MSAVHENKLNYLTNRGGICHFELMKYCTHFFLILKYMYVPEIFVFVLYQLTVY